MISWLSLLSNAFHKGPRLHGFHGGIKPLAHKARSLRSVIMGMPIPPFLYIPLLAASLDHIHLCVQVGDRVLKGQKLADISGSRTAPAHASSSGVVTAINNHAIPDEFGREALCVTLETDGFDQWCEVQAIENYCQLPRDVLLEKIREAGIVGLGGAGFPSADKYKSGFNKTIKTLIINAAECEPYITPDQALLRERAADVVRGIKILQQLSTAERCIIAIEKNKADAIAALEKALSGTTIELAKLAPVYPTGSEKQLIQQLTGKEVPSGGLPADIGVLLSNIGTGYSVFRAIVKGQPLLSRITTVCGDTIATAKNFEALIGTPVAFLFELCGIDYQKLSRVVMGGSLMGFTLTNLDVPLLKTSNCLVAGSTSEFPAAPEPIPCIRCGYCATACPAVLQPQQLYHLIRSDDLNKASRFGLQDCIECGACAWICPSHIPLVQYFRAGKAELREQKKSQEIHHHWQQRFEMHQYRIARKEKQKPPSGKSDTRPEITDTVPSFSRETAKTEIAAAVARVKARKSALIASNHTDSPRTEEKNDQ